MKPIKYGKDNTLFAKDQSQYGTLPARVARGGEVVSCWKLSPLERIKVLFTGRIFLMVCTFRKPLPPVWIGLDDPIIDPPGDKL